MRLPEWTPRSDSDQRRQSAIAIAESALAARKNIVPAHLREILSIAVWKFTECDGKYSTRFRSERSLFSASSDIHHEHVIPRREIVERMLADPKRVGEILSEAIGCVVLRPEHRALALVEKENPKLSGWDRYRAAQIPVWDLQDGVRIV